MELLSELAIQIKQELWLISWRDILEIIFFSVLMHQIIVWLGQDQQKKLLLGFYSYVGLLITSYYLNISGIFFILLIGSPVVAMLFILLHQKTLQHNYVALKNKAIPDDRSDQWIEEFIQTLLYGINKNKKIIGVIERRIPLEAFFIARCTFNTPLSRELLTMLISNSETANDHVTLWINDTGNLLAVNPYWKAVTDEIWLNPEVKLAEKHVQDAALITQQTDAIIVTLSPDSRLFSVLCHGKHFENISASAVFSLIKQYILSTQNNHQQGIKYDNIHQTTQHSKQSRN